MAKYICFDVETPNLKNDRMSSIGICTVENEIITNEFYSLVNPEEHFDTFNIEFTGITPLMASKAPTFAEIWSTIRPILEDGLLIAHNAQFDMSVLSKCLKAYNLPCPDTEYACTCRMGQRILPQMENHRLDTICHRLNIPLDHHNALSDARGCAKILIYYLNSGAVIEDFSRPYSLKETRTLRYKPCRR